MYLDAQLVACICVCSCCITKSVQKPFLFLPIISKQTLLDTDALHMADNLQSMDCFPYGISSLGRYGRPLVIHNSIGLLLQFLTKLIMV